MAGIESLLVGRTLGDRYRIEEVIGRGGMGAVYRAVDERLGRQVALKVVTAPTSDAEARERLRHRFFREARSAAALPHHPNVVPVYDYGSDEALGIDFLVMELLRGSDLATRLSTTGAPPLSTSLRILLEAARGLAVGHAQGLIHRDVKPGNIFLARTHGDEVQVRVVDFGIAKVADDDTLAQLTQDGRVPHSPAYASPEQLRGLSNLTPAADVFALGAVGFQLLTGERPFNEQDRNRMSLGIPVEVPPLRVINPAIPGTVEAVVRRALSFDPEARYPNAGGFAAALESAMRAIADTPVEPYSGGAPIMAASDGPTGYRGDESGPAIATESVDDRTMISPLPADDDRTLVAPPAGRLAPLREFADEPTPAIHEAPSGPAHRATEPVRPPSAPPPAAAPSRIPRRPQEPERRGAGGIVLRTAAVVGLVAAGVWGWNRLGDTETPIVAIPDADSAAEARSDSIEDARLAEAEALTLSQEGVAAYTADPPRYAEALRLFERAVILDPDDWHYRRNHGMTLSQLGNHQAAVLELEVALELDSTQAVTWASLGSAHLARGDTTGAITAFRESVAREPNPGDRARIESIVRELQLAGQPTPPLLGEPIEPEPLPATNPSPPPAAVPSTPSSSGGPGAG